MQNAYFDAISTAANTTRSGDRLVNLSGFGTNPGALRARLYLPARLAERPALVVVLHGCTQTAAAYDHGSGWSRLADRYGFAVLYPEQTRTNNANLCFNWFEPEDTARDKGEALSIRQMIEMVAAAHHLDRNRIFITGLSAGGAMVSVMLATYPEIFAGGAIIAGLPYGCASNVQQAFGAMRSGGQTRPDALAELIRRASGHEGPWPTVSVWHGSSDGVVAPKNAGAIVEQWLPVHGISKKAFRNDIVDGYPHRVWSTVNGRVVVESYSITGMGHGTPLASGGADSFDVAGPHMLNAGISSSRRIADFWGLTSNEIARPIAERSRNDEAAKTFDTNVSLPVRHARRLQPESTPARKIDVRRIIDDALRAGGLLK